MILSVELWRDLCVHCRYRASPLPTMHPQFHMILSVVAMGGFMCFFVDIILPVPHGNSVVTTLHASMLPTMQTIRLPPFLQRCYTTLFYFISSLIGESCVHFGSIPLSGLTNVPLSYLVHASTIRTPFISYLLVDFISFGADSGEIEPRYTHIFSLCLPLSRLVATRYVESSVIHTWLPYTEGSH